MTTSGPSRDDRLERALGLWADAARLPVAQGTEMLMSIMSTPVPAMPEPPSRRSALPLSGSWWREHSAGLAATFVSSSRALAAVA